MISKGALVVSLCSSLLLWACTDTSYPGHRHVGNGAYVHLHTLGEDDRKITAGDRVYVDLRLSTLTTGNGSLFSGQLAFDILDEDKSGFILALRRSHAGDSLSIIFPTKDPIWSALDTSTLRPESDTTMLRAELRVLSVLTQAEAKAEHERHEAWIEDKELDERAALALYLNVNRLDTSSYWGSGMYVFIQDTGSAPHLRTGDVATIHYTATTIDGNLFDDTHRSGNPLQYMLGDPEQVIHGIDMGLRSLGIGGKATFIIPSDLAFGAKGSAAGIVPPFTTVIYRVEVVGAEQFPRRTS